jgi:hypothetical protein
MYPTHMPITNTVVMHTKFKDCVPKNVLLSYSGSGNHLVRFFIELLTERPTYGWDFVKEDVPICNAIFDEPIPFNITADSEPIYKKEHFAPGPEREVEQLIVVVRHPREVLVRQVGINLNTMVDGTITNTNMLEHHAIQYATILKYYVDHKGPKLLLFYEDMITKTEEFVKQLYDFLKPNKPEKLEYALKNLDKLFQMSKGGKNRIWLGPKSNGKPEFYYDKLKYSSKEYLTNTLNAFLAHPVLKPFVERYVMTI